MEIHIRKPSAEDYRTLTLSQASTNDICLSHNPTATIQVDVNNPSSADVAKLRDIPDEDDVVCRIRKPLITSHDHFPL